jgi:glucan biosynthesis protein C
MIDPEARRHDVDWLRVGATYLLFVFHVAKVFDPAPFYHVRNGELSMGMLILSGFISLWHMPLFFVLAGWSIPGSIRARGAGGFVRERVLRLFVPLVAGTAIFGPPIKYLELSSGLDANYTGLYVAPELQAGIRQVLPQGLPEAAPFTQTFLEFWPTFFHQLDRVTWAHLWFLAYLFTFSMLYAPVLAWLARRPGSSRSVGAAWVYLPMVPIAVIQVFLRPHWPGLQNLYDDWANVAMYTVYLFAGFLIARSLPLEEAVHREWKRAFAVALAAMVVLLAGVAGAITSGAVILAATGVAGWCFIVGLLGLARRHLSFATAALPYLVESALPVYVLHQAAIVLPGYWIVKLPLGIAAKFALLLVVSVALTMAVYDLVVRRLALTRFLFGMRPLPVRSQGRPPARRAAAGIALAIAGAGAVVALSPGRSDAAASPLGTWLAEGGAATVEISPCGNALCGRVVWLRSPLDGNGCGLRDEQNPDPALRDRPVVGLEVLRGLVEEDAGRWAGGTIYDPGSGSTYRCEASLEDPDRLELRGYIGIPLIGRTTTWIRLGAEERMCAASRS